MELQQINIRYTIYSFHNKYVRLNGQQSFWAIFPIDKYKHTFYYSSCKERKKIRIIQTVLANLWSRIWLHKNFVINSLTQKRCLRRIAEHYTRLLYIFDFQKSSFSSGSATNFNIFTNKIQISMPFSIIVVRCALTTFEMERNHQGQLAYISKSGHWYRG